MSDTGRGRTGSTWLPSEPAVPTEKLEPWQPPSVIAHLESGVEWESLAYVVVDELQADVVGLVVSRWPRVDGRGRLHFGDEDESSRIATQGDAFRALLHEERTPVMPVALDPEQEDALRERDVSVGDVFAVKLKRPQGGRGGGPGGGGGLEAEAGAPLDPREWCAPPILDITAEANEVAKAQTSATLSGAMDQDYLELIAEEINEDEGGPTNTTPPPNVPTPSGSSSGGGAAAAPDTAAASQATASARSAEAGRAGATGADPDEIVRERERLRRELEAPEWHRPASESEEGSEDEAEGEAGPEMTAGA